MHQSVITDQPMYGGQDEGMSPSQPQPQPIDPTEAAFQAIRNDVRHVSLILGCQGAANTIKSFEGVLKLYHDWIREIEKYKLMVFASDQDCVMIAYQTSRGPVTGFIQRYREEHPGVNWVTLKQELAKRFSEIPDKQLALTLLRQIKQKLGENIYVYVERLRSFAEAGYQDINAPDVQNQLVDIFVNGLINNETLKVTILRKEPHRLSDAVDIATKELNLRHRVAVAGGQTNPKFHYSQNRALEDHPIQSQTRQSEGHIPMEINHSRGRYCYKCQGRGHHPKDCRIVRNVGVTCYECGQQGHMTRECGQTRQRRVTCFKCGEVGHISPECGGKAMYRNIDQNGGKQSLPGQ